VINDCLLLLFRIDVHPDDPQWIQSNKLTVAVKELLTFSCIVSALRVKAIYRLAEGSLLE
jgi:hypothetical protein